MLRWVLLILGLGAIAWGAASLAEFPGTMSLTWQDWRIDTSIGVFIGTLIVLAALAAIIYRIWWTVLRAPRLLSRSRHERRQRLGYEALSRGLVAVAAGDAETARRQARRAETLLDGRSLTMLLSAQAAQLQGDDEAATRFFAAMRDRPDTEFLGVRGLLTQAMRRQDWDEGMRLAERAQQLDPKSEWVMSALYDLQKRTGRWADAEGTLKRRMALHQLPPAEAPRERSEILLKQSEAGSSEASLELAKKAFQADPGYPPAAARYATLCIAAGRHARAAEAIERTWAILPDAELTDIYADARQAHDALARVKAMQRLATHNPDHAESRIAVAVAALEARLWGEARSNLESIAGEDASPRVCRLMAELEEAEHGDLARARTWLLRASGEAPRHTAEPPAAIIAGAAEVRDLAIAESAAAEPLPQRG